MKTDRFGKRPEQVHTRRTTCCYCGDALGRSSTHENSGESRKVHRHSAGDASGRFQTDAIDGGRSGTIDSADASAGVTGWLPPARRAARGPCRPRRRAGDGSVLDRDLRESGGIPEALEDASKEMLPTVRPRRGDELGRRSRPSRWCRRAEERQSSSESLAAIDPVEVADP